MSHLSSLRQPLLLLCLVTSILIQPFSAKAQDVRYAEFFEEAYRTYSSVPRGLLEAVAYTNTRITHVKPGGIGSCTDLPQYYGVMGLVADGKGYFQNSLLRVSELSGYSVREIMDDPRINILAYAAAYSAMQQNKRMTARSVTQQEPVLGELSEIPLDGSEHNKFALDQQFYSVLNEMQSPHSGTRHRTRQAFNFEDIFGRETYRRLSANRLVLTRTSSRDITASTDPMPCTSSNNKVDYKGAIKDIAHTRNWGSRGSTEVEHIAIHTIQGSYASAISWFKNPNARVSAHYIIRAFDGQITQMVCEKDKGYHVRTDNGTAIGLEHEGFIDEGGSWYTNEMYESSAALVRDICQRHGIDPLKTFGGPPTNGTRTLTNTCYKIKGHQHFRGNDHIDPGPFWDWDRYYRLINPEPAPKVFTEKKGTITDSGGKSGNYTDQDRATYLIKPAGATSLTLTFDMLDLEGEANKPYDYLDIYDGESVDGQYIGRFSGSVPPGKIEAKSGKVFIEFRSDCQINKGGWVISYTSKKKNSSCPTPENLLASNIFPMGVTLSWDGVGDADHYLLYVRRKLEERWALYKTRQTQATITGLSSNGLYQWQVQAICGSDSSAVAGNRFITPNINRTTNAQIFSVRLNQGRFHDSGGTFAGYANNENYLYRIIPLNGERIQLTFTSFETEENLDQMVIYDGLNTNGKVLGTFSGKRSPGKITSSGGGMCILFKSDRRTTGSGWTASWRTIGGGTGPIADNGGSQPPVTDPDPGPGTDPVTEPGTDPVVTPPIADDGTFDPGLEFGNRHPVSKPNLKNSYSSSFTLSFNDQDKSGRGLVNRFYNLVPIVGGKYANNAQKGYFFDDFNRGKSTGWKSVSGSWSTANGRLKQTNTSLSNTNYYHALRQRDDQVYVYHWQAKMEGSGNNRRHGIHFFVSKPKSKDRGNSYFVWVRDSDNKDYIEIYKTVNDVFDRKMVRSVNLEKGKVYDYKAIYNPQKGRIEVYLNNKFVASWVDRYPLDKGEAISLRSGNCVVSYDNLQVYIRRSGSSVPVSVGPGAKNGLKQDGPFMAHSLVVDRNIRWSDVGEASSKIDLDGSSEPPVDDGGSEDGSGTPPAAGNSFSEDFSWPVANPSAVEQFFLPLSRAQDGWQANAELGFFNDAFPGNSLLSSWQATQGSWQVSNGILQQRDGSEANANLYTFLRQTSDTYLYHWRARVQSSGDNRRFGLHFFASDGSQTNRGNSYMVWFRYHESKADVVEIYRADNNVLPRFDASKNVSFRNKEWLDCKVVYNARTGKIDAYINNQLAISWTDDKRPHNIGQAISLRTGNAVVEFDDLRVYRIVGQSPVQLSVGSSDMFQTKSQGTQSAAQLLSIFRERSGRWSGVKEEEFVIK